jgi:hypothetical protein
MGVSPSSKKDFTKLVRECYFSILRTALIQNLKFNFKMRSNGLKPVYPINTHSIKNKRFSKNPKTTSYYAKNELFNQTSFAPNCFDVFGQCDGTG